MPSEREIPVILGDLNAKTGRSNHNIELKYVIKKWGLGEKNKRREKLIDFCLGKTVRDLYKIPTPSEEAIHVAITWKKVSKSNRLFHHEHQVETVIRDVKTYPGKDCGNYHQFLVVESIKAESPTKAKPGNKRMAFRKKYDTQEGDERKPEEDSHTEGDPGLQC